MSGAESGVWHGVVRSDRLVLAAEVVLLDARTGRELGRRCVHVPFFLELDDGTLLPVEPSRVFIPHVESTRGLWETVRGRLGSCLLPREVKGGHGRTWLELRERIVCAGDRVSMRGALHRGAPRTDGYRLASERPAAIRALEMVVSAPTARSVDRLCAQEREHYGIPPAGSAASRGEEGALASSQDAARVLHRLSRGLEKFGDFLLDPETWE